MLLVLLISMWVSLIWYGLRSPVDPVSVPEVAFTTSLLAFPIVGRLIAVRRPQNPLGWIFLTIPLVLGIGGITDEFAIRSAQAGSDSTAAILLIAGGWFQFQ